MCDEIMRRPTSPPLPSAQRKGRLWRILGIAASLVALALLAKLAGWIFFHGLVPDSLGSVPLVVMWEGFRDYLSDPKNEIIFDAAVFSAGLLLFVLIIGAWQVARRFAVAQKQRLARWASLAEPKDLPKLENDLRASRLQVITTIAQIGGGTALLIGIYFTYQSLKTTREGQITDRFIRAVDQLGATNKDGCPAREIRLGGIYGLRRIAQDSSEDYKPVREILNDYVRLNAPWRDQAGTEMPVCQQLAASTPGTAVHPEADIQAALDFLGNPIQKFEKQTPTAVRLPGTDLRGATLNSAHLEHADLVGAHLEHASLSLVHLAHADLRNAHLDFAHLVAAHVDGAVFTGAHLEGANLGWVPDGWTQEQIDSTYGNAKTKLPAGIATPAPWNTAH